MTPPCSSPAPRPSVVNSPLQPAATRHPLRLCTAPGHFLPSPMPRWLETRPLGGVCVDMAPLKPGRFRIRQQIESGILMGTYYAWTRCINIIPSKDEPLILCWSSELLSDSNLFGGISPAKSKRIQPLKCSNPTLKMLAQLLQLLSHTCCFALGYGNFMIHESFLEGCVCFFSILQILFW